MKIVILLTILFLGFASCSNQYPCTSIDSKQYCLENSDCSWCPVYSTCHFIGSEARCGITSNDTKYIKDGMNLVLIIVLLHSLWIVLYERSIERAFWNFIPTIIIYQIIVELMKSYLHSPNE